MIKGRINKGGVTMPKSKNIEYRRRTTKGHHKWHFCKNCNKGWPEANENFERTYVRPKVEEICKFCKSKADYKSCKRVYRGKT